MEPVRKDRGREQAEATVIAVRREDSNSRPIAAADRARDKAVVKDRAVGDAVVSDKRVNSASLVMHFTNITI